MNPPPTIQCRVEPPASIAPYALVTVNAAPEAGLSEIRPLVERWTGAYEDYSHAWAEFAAAHHLVGSDKTPFFRPDFVYCGRHRWIATSQEAPGALYVYAGLCAVAGEPLPELAAVAERASALIQILGECRLHRGHHRIRLRVSGQMYIRGNATGHEHRPRKRYLTSFGDPDTIREALPLFAASYGGLFASGPASRIPVLSYLITLAISVLAYCFLAWMRWITAGGQAGWTSTGWPQ
jgi:hypothetical protein